MSRITVPKLLPERGRTLTALVGGFYPFRPRGRFREHHCTKMVSVIKDFSYKTPGRGRGILGLRDFKPCRRPGAACRAEGRTDRPGETEAEAGPASDSKGKVA